MRSFFDYAANLTEKVAEMSLSLKTESSQREANQNCQIPRNLLHLPLPTRRRTAEVNATGYVAPLQALVAVLWDLTLRGCELFGSGLATTP